VTTEGAEYYDTRFASDERKDRKFKSLYECWL